MTLFALSFLTSGVSLSMLCAGGGPRFRLLPHLLGDQGLARQRPDAGNRRRHPGRREGLSQPAGDHDQRDRGRHFHPALHLERPRHRGRFSRRRSLLALGWLYRNANRGPGQYAHHAGGDQIADGCDAGRFQWRRGDRFAGRRLSAPLGRNFLYGCRQNDRPRARGDAASSAWRWARA